MAPLPRSRTIASCALLVFVALHAGACARRYAASLSVSAPTRNIDASPIASSATPPATLVAGQKPAVRAAKPSPVVRSRPAPRPPATTTDAIGTTGEDIVGPQLPAAAVVTVTTTPSAQGPSDAPASNALTTIIVRTLRRPAAAVPIGAGFAASAFASVVLYRRRHRLPN
jgi:hypothetical protein